MKCPLCQTDLVRPTRRRFKATKVIDGVTYRAKACPRCYHIYLIVEMLVTPDLAERLELMSFSDVWLDPQGTSTDGTETTVSSAARLRALSESENFSRLPSTPAAETTPPSSERD